MFHLSVHSSPVTARYKVLSSQNWFTRRTGDQRDRVKVHCGCSGQPGKLTCGRTTKKQIKNKWANIYSWLSTLGYFPYTDTKICSSNHTCYISTPSHILICGHLSLCCWQSQQFYLPWLWIWSQENIAFPREDTLTSRPFLQNACKFCCQFLSDIHDFGRKLMRSKSLAKIAIAATETLCDFANRSDWSTKFSSVSPPEDDTSGHKGVLATGGTSLPGFKSNQITMLSI